jgi:hypothetical protein
MNFDLTNQYLERTYEEIQREQIKLMTELKNNNENDGKDIQKQISMINIICINLLKLRNLKKSIQEKKNNC